MWKLSIIRTLGVLLAIAAVAPALAQPGGSPSNPESRPAVSSPSTDQGSPPASPGATTAPGGAVTQDPKAQGDRTSPPSGAVTRPRANTDDAADGSALPRSTTVERTTIFGLSPTATILIGAALLIVVILAIVAMTRTTDTRVPPPRV
jgi:hypothetical protein